MTGIISALALPGAASAPSRLQKQWRKPEPKASYDAIIVGAADTAGRAYYWRKSMADQYPVLEKAGSRRQHRPQYHHHSLHYLFNESAALYDHSVKLWENLSQVLTTTSVLAARSHELAHGP